MKQERWRSKIMWISVLAVVGGVVTRYIPGIAEDYQLITDAVITVLALVGVLNNPTDKEHF